MAMVVCTEHSRHVVCSSRSKCTVSSTCMSTVSTTYWSKWPTLSSSDSVSTTTSTVATRSSRRCLPTRLWAWCASVREQGMKLWSTVRSLHTLPRRGTLPMVVCCSMLPISVYITSPSTFSIRYAPTTSPTCPTTSPRRRYRTCHPPPGGLLSRHLPTV